MSWFNPTLSWIYKRKSTLADFVFHLVNCVTAPKEGCNQRERTADATDVWFHRYWKSGRHPSGPLVIEVLKHEAADTWQVLRSEFDQLLMDNAREKGAEVMEEVTVRDENVSFVLPRELVTLMKARR